VEPDLLHGVHLIYLDKKITVINGQRRKDRDQERLDSHVVHMHMKFQLYALDERVAMFSF
jgi:hypothetical protein